MTTSTKATTAVGALLLVGAVVVAAWPQSDEGAGQARPARAVRLATVESSPGERIVRLAGVTRAVKRAELAFAIPGRLAARPVEVGDHVAAGQPVATLDGRAQRLAERAAVAALAEVEVRLAQAHRDAERVERLAATGAATTEELERSRAGLAALAATAEAAAASLAEARRLVAECTLAAPFAATVTAVHLEPNEWASPGAATVELAGDGAVEVAIEAPEAVRAGLRVGRTVTIELPFLRHTARGRIDAVAAAARQNGLFHVEVAIDPGTGVVAGLAAEVPLPVVEEPGMTVPLAALRNPGADGASVLRVDAGRVHRVPVSPGRVLGERVLVAGGLRAGDQVVVSGHSGLADGDAVEVL